MSQLERTLAISYKFSPRVWQRRKLRLRGRRCQGALGIKQALPILPQQFQAAELKLHAAREIGPDFSNSLAVRYRESPFLKFSKKIDI
jgi:hypothetical protein